MGAASRPAAPLSPGVVTVDAVAAGACRPRWRLLSGPTRPRLRGAPAGDLVALAGAGGPVADVQQRGEHDQNQSQPISPSAEGCRAARTSGREGQEDDAQQGQQEGVEGGCRSKPALPPPTGWTMPGRGKSRPSARTDNPSRPPVLVASTVPMRPTCHRRRRRSGRLLPPRPRPTASCGSSACDSPPAGERESPIGEPRQSSFLVVPAPLDAFILRTFARMRRMTGPTAKTALRATSSAPRPNPRQHLSPARLSGHVRCRRRCDRPRIDGKDGVAGSIPLEGFTRGTPLRPSLTPRQLRAPGLRTP